MFDFVKIGKTLEGRGWRITPKDVFLGEDRSKSVFPLLILHMVRKRPEYGNSIIRGIKETTSGVSVSPNTVYSLLRR